MKQFKRHLTVSQDVVFKYHAMEVEVQATAVQLRMPQ